MSGPADFVRQAHPAGLEAQRGKLRLEQPPDLTNPGKIERAAVDVDGFLEEADLFRFVRFDVVPNALLDLRKRGISRFPCLCRGLLYRTQEQRQCERQGRETTAQTAGDRSV